MILEVKPVMSNLNPWYLLLMFIFIFNKNNVRICVKFIFKLT